jgi:hypothetical protein
MGVRTREEIRARLAAVRDLDPFGFALSDFGIYLPEEVAKGIADKAEEPPEAEEMLKQAREYLPFAFDKAVNHRGLSAMRSVLHLMNWAWLGGRDDLVAFADDDDDYPRYGVPVLIKFATELGVPLPDEIASWPGGGREPCRPGCEGCNT